MGDWSELLGPALGLVITGLLMLVGVLPIYFIMKKISGSKTTFREDLQEYLNARSQPPSRRETLGLLSVLDSAESIFLQIYKYLLIIALVLGTFFIVWFFTAVQNESERSFLRLYFGAAYLFLVFWVVGSLLMMKRRQARISPVPSPAVLASIDPASRSGIKAAASKDASPAASTLTPQQIVILVMVFVFTIVTVSVSLLMLKGLPL